MDYIKSIEAWSTLRGVDKTNSDKQLIKLGEEFGELAEAHNKGWLDKIEDSLGDMFVVMTIYAQQNGMSLSDCIVSAYDTIRDRKGRMIDGVFVKEADLDKEEPEKKYYYHLIGGDTYKYISKVLSTGEWLLTSKDIYNPDFRDSFTEEEIKESPYNLNDFEKVEVK